MFGLIGKKLGHSFSAEFFNKKFRDEKIDETYRLFEIPSIEDFPKLLAENPDLKGLNVTIPYKRDVISFLSGLSVEAKAIGAVNVIKISRGKEGITLTGYNSDSIGFEESLKPLLNKSIDKALVLGTGGASKAVCYVLRKLGIEPTYVSRTPKEGQLTYKDLNKSIIDSHLLIVNTTPLGMMPEIDTCPPIPYNLLTTRHICYDLVYNPLETLFLKKSKEAGAKIKNGMEMLELQALASWDIWNKNF